MKSFLVTAMASLLTSMSFIETTCSRYSFYRVAALSLSSSSSFASSPSRLRCRPQIVFIRRSFAAAAAAETKRNTSCGSSSSSSSSSSDDDDSSERTQKQLSWERFEFSDSPKWDVRFEDGKDILARTAAADSDGANTSKEQVLERLYREESKLDDTFMYDSRQRTQLWDDLDADIVQRAIETIRPCVNDDRVDRISTVLKKRTRHTRFLFENPSNPSNAWACLRSIEAFGIQHIHVIIQSGQYEGKAAIVQKRGMRTAMGSAQWLTIHNHPDTQSAVRHITRDLGCKLYVSDLNEHAKDIRSIDWDGCSSGDGNDNDDDGDDKSKKDDDRPICIVMGNENRGVSDEMRDLADETFFLPMVGFAESFNLSVATAITLAHLSSSSGCYDQEQGGGGACYGPLRPGDLDPHEYNCLFLKGLLNSLPQRRIAEALLRKAGVHLPLKNLF